jgi:hypothetical protein
VWDAVVAQATAEDDASRKSRATRAWGSTTTWDRR